MVPTNLASDVAAAMSDRERLLWKTAIGGFGSNMADRGRLKSAMKRHLLSPLCGIRATASPRK